MAIVGVTVLMIGAVLIYLGFSGETIGDLMRTIFGP